VDVAAGSALYIEPRVPHGADSLGEEPLGMFYVYGCETAGHEVNWTAVEDVYTGSRRRA
jgi:mannose-6-phosphate isomerase-like protein (cupin superfamily)